MKLTHFALILGATAALCLNAQAVTILTPMTLDTEFLIGVADGKAFEPTIPNEAAAAQTILDLALGEVDSPYRANTTFDYSGTIDASSGVKDESTNTSVGAGWQYALAKYNGKNGGSILFYLGGEATDLPSTSADLWTNDEGEGYGLSHFTTFNLSTPPPPPGTDAPDGGTTVALFGLALLGLGGSRKLLRK